MSCCLFNVCWSYRFFGVLSWCVEICGVWFGWFLLFVGRLIALQVRLLDCDRVKLRWWPSFHIRYYHKLYVFEFKRLQDANVRRDAWIFPKLQESPYFGGDQVVFLPTFARTMRWFTPRRLSGMWPTQTHSTTMMQFWLLWSLPKTHSLRWGAREWRYNEVQCPSINNLGRNFCRSLRKFSVSMRSFAKLWSCRYLKADGFQDLIVQYQYLQWRLHVILLECFSDFSAIQRCNTVRP